MIGIALTKGFMVWVDPEDADLSLLAWGALSNGTSRYGYRKVKANGRSITLLMHRVIAERMGLSMAHEIDHIDGDSLNNRRSNLRAATRGENARNRAVQSNCKSGIKGVHWHKRVGKWIATIKVAQIPIHLGVFDSIELAAAAYAEASKKHHGEFGRTA